MRTRHKLLLLDDDREVADLYCELLAGLPSQPEVYVATSGARALSLLESESFTLLLSDLQMPRMDGLQVLTVVRRKFPHLRTAIMTAVAEDHFRARAYAIGVDLFLEKPSTSTETSSFLDCIEALLVREEIKGFRGLQSKSLVDLLQLECLSRSSSTLKINNGLLDGKIWIQEGEITDAASETLTGETAFRKILSWKTGSFEVLPPEPARSRTIFASYQGLLLETAHALDEAQAQPAPSLHGADPGLEEDEKTSLPTELGQLKGVEFMLMRSSDEKQSCKQWGVENPDQIAGWMSQALRRFRILGESLEAGQLNQIEGSTAQQKLALLAQDEKEMCIAFHHSSSPDLIRQNTKTILSAWAS